MIKVLHIITRLDMGGSAQNTLLCCLGLSKDKYEVVLAHGLSLESQMTDSEAENVRHLKEKATKQGVKIVPIPSLVRNIKPMKDLFSLLSIRRLILKEKPVIVHTHTSKGGIIGRWAAKLAKTPVIAHTPHGHVFYGHFGTWFSKLFFILEKLTAPITDHVIALTDTEKNDYMRLALYSPENVTTIHSGVDIDRFSGTLVDNRNKKKSLGLDSRYRVVGTVGWLLPIKGPKVLLDAMKIIWQSLSDAALVYVGKGPLLEALQHQARLSGVNKKVKFLGWREDIQEILPILDIFVLPSLNEGMGRVLVEAMASGRPIIASRAGGITDLIMHEQNGLLFPPGDSKALADAILSMLKNPDRAKEMGIKGKTLCQQFSIEKMIEKIDTLYSNLIRNINMPSKMYTLN